MSTQQPTTFIQQCETVAGLAEQLQKALDVLRPQLGGIDNKGLINIANEVVRTRGTPREAAPQNPEAIDAAMADTTTPKTNGTNGAATRQDGDPTAKLPRVVRKVAKAARSAYQGKQFAMADVGELLKVGSRTLIPTFNSLEKKGFFKKVGRGKRNGQDVNLYRLGKQLVAQPS